MGVKELIVDSWQNMFKNKFILKTILVVLAFLLVYCGGILAVSLLSAFNDFLGFVAIVALIIVIVPISIATTKVMFDVFQGRDAKIFGFLSYGFQNFSRLWGIVGRTILKLLVLYIIRIVLMVALIVYIGGTFVSIINDATQSSTAGQVKHLETEQYVESTLDSLDSDLLVAEKDVEGLISSLDTAVEDETISADVLGQLRDALAPYEGTIGQSLAVLGLYAIVSLIIDILIYAKSLYYRYAPILAFEDDSLVAKDAVQKSEDLMRGHRAQYFWTFVLVFILVCLVCFLLMKIDNAIVELVLFVIYILFIVYGTSYDFTFFNKLVGNDTSSGSPVTESAPVVEDVPVVEETPVKEEEPEEEKPSNEE